VPLAHQAEAHAEADAAAADVAAEALRLTQSTGEPISGGPLGPSGVELAAQQQESPGGGSNGLGGSSSESVAQLCTSSSSSVAAAASSSSSSSAAAAAVERGAAAAGHAAAGAGAEPEPGPAELVATLGPIPRAEAEVIVRRHLRAQLADATKRSDEAAKKARRLRGAADAATRRVGRVGEGLQRSGWRVRRSGCTVVGPLERVSRETERESGASLMMKDRGCVPIGSARPD